MIKAKDHASLIRRIPTYVVVECCQTCEHGEWHHDEMTVFQKESHNVWCAKFEELVSCAGKCDDFSI